MPKRRVYFDFDETLVQEHTLENARFGTVSSTPPAPSFYTQLSMQKNGRHPEIITAIIQCYQRKGVEVGIVSYHNGKLSESADYAIANQGTLNRVTGAKYIREHLALSHPKLNLENIYIEAFLPSSPEEAEMIGKNIHIRNAIEASNKTCHPSDVINLDNAEHRKLITLIDDSATNVKLAKEHGYNACYVKTTSNSEPDDVMLGIHSDIFDREYLEFLVKDSEISVKELLAVADEISKKGGLMPFMICHLMTYAEELAKTKSKTESEAKTASDVPSVDSTSCSSKDITPKAIESTGKPFLPLASKLEVSTAVTATSSSSTSAASQSTAPAIPVAGSSTTVGSSVTASEEASSSPKLTATV